MSKRLSNALVAANVILTCMRLARNQPKSESEKVTMRSLMLTELID